MATYHVEEGGTTIVWGRNNTPDPLTVTWSAFSGTATIGVDALIPASGSFVVPAFSYGEFRYDIVSDGENEGEEVYFVDVFWNGNLVNNAIMIIAGDPGGASIDIITGDDGINLFSPAGGHHVIEGQSGFDTVNYMGPRDDYVILTKNENVVEVTKPTGVDALFSIERVEFDDGALLFDIESVNAPGAYRLYGGAFDRTPDEEGLLFWIGNLDDGNSLRDAANFFINSPEFLELYGTGLSDADFVSQLYLNVLGRAGEDGGVNFWNTYLAEGGDRADALVNFTQLEEYVSLSLADIDNGYWVM